MQLRGFFVTGATSTTDPDPAAVQLAVRGVSGAPPPSAVSPLTAGMDGDGSQCGPSACVQWTGRVESEGNEHWKRTSFLILLHAIPPRGRARISPLVDNPDIGVIFQIPSRYLVIS